MIEAILGIFTNESKAEAILANPIIEFIFVILFITFIIAFFVHVVLYSKLKHIRNYLKETNRMDIEPLLLFDKQFKARQASEYVKPETFVQEKFSGWRILQIPVVSWIKIIQMTVSLFVLIGVLGTFIGLTISLSSINTDGEQLVENVAAVLSGIDVAFYTSIAGMGLSLIMTVLIKVLNTEYMLTEIMLIVESNLEANEQGGISRLIDVSETIHQSIVHLQETNTESLQAIVRSFSGFQEYTTGLEQSAKDLALFNEGLSENLQQFQRLFDHMKKVTDGFSEGTKELNHNFTALFSYFKKSDGKNERVTKAIEQIYEKAKEVAHTQMQTLDHFEASVGELKQFTTSIVDTQTTMQNTFEKINEKSTDLVKQMGQHNSNLKNIFGDSLHAQLAGIVTYLKELSKDFDMLEKSIIRLPEALDIINETQVQYKHLLADRFKELEAFNHSFSNHIKAHVEQSDHFEKKVLETTNMFEQIGKKNNQFMHDINGTIAKMNQTFNQREHDIEKSIHALKETLTAYGDILEGTLGDKLDRIVRSIHDSVETTTQGLNREFRELSRVAEDMQQANFRYIQQVLQELNREIQLLNRQFSIVSQQNGNGSQNGRLSQNEY